MRGNSCGGTNLSEVWNEPKQMEVFSAKMISLVGGACVLFGLAGDPRD